MQVKYILRVCSIRFSAVVLGCPNAIRSEILDTQMRRFNEYKYQFTDIHWQFVIPFNSKILHFIVVCKMIPCTTTLIFTSPF